MNFEDELVRLLPWMSGLAGRYCADKMDAEDLVGETVLKLIANRNRFDIRKPLKPWCEAIMQNTYITCYNRSQIVRFVRSDTTWSAVSDNHANDSAYVRDILEAISRCRMKSCCVDCLIRYSEGYSYGEISDMLGIPVGTVRSRISFARMLLHKELEIKS